MMNILLTPMLSGISGKNANIRINRKVIKRFRLDENMVSLPGFTIVTLRLTATYGNTGYKVSSLWIQN